MMTTQKNATIDKMDAIDNRLSELRDEIMRLERERSELVSVLKRKTIFAVRTRRGGGWDVPAAPECPYWSAQDDAIYYAKLRNDGMSHLKAWEYAEGRRIAKRNGEKVDPA